MRALTFERTSFNRFLRLPRIILNRQVDMLCGYLCYTTLLSLIPLILLFLIVGHWVGARDRETYLVANQLLDLLTPESTERLRVAISELYQNVKIKRLGLTVTIPLILFMFLKIRMLRASFQDLLGETRSFPWLLDLLLFIGLLAAFPLLFPMLDAFLLSQVPRSVWFFSSVSKIIFMFMVLGFLMRLFLPVHTPFMREVLAALGGALVLGLGNRLFSLLTTHVFQMNRIYGAFASIPLFLIWIYFFWMTLVSCILICSDRWRRDIAPATVRQMPQVPQAL